MARSANVTAFPWGTLEPLTRTAEATLRSARRQLERAVEPRRLAQAVTELVGQPVELVVRRVSARGPSAALIRIGLALDGGEWCASVGVEAPLATALLAALLRRDVPLVASDVALDPTLLGALSALLVEAARATGARCSLTPLPAPAITDAAVVHVTVILGGKPYVAALGIAPPSVAARDAAMPTAVALLVELGETPVALPLVVAESTLPARDLDALAVGAAFCPGSGWRIDAAGRGSGVLVAPDAERGIGVELGDTGQIVLRQAATVALAPAEERPMENDSSSEPQTLADAVLEAPVVVRVELGQVSMKAREWAELRAGDVVGTGQRIGEPVVLRAAGQVLARGELVNLEGELAVRILEVMGRELRE